VVIVLIVHLLLIAFCHFHQINFVDPPESNAAIRRIDYRGDMTNRRRTRIELIRNKA